MKPIFTQTIECSLKASVIINFIDLRHNLPKKTVLWLCHLVIPITHVTSAFAIFIKMVFYQAVRLVEKSNDKGYLDRKHKK